jgi:hypothetical protein
MISTGQLLLNNIHAPPLYTNLIQLLTLFGALSVHTISTLLA